MSFPCSFDQIGSAKNMDEQYQSYAALAGGSLFFELQYFPFSWSVFHGDEKHRENKPWLKWSAQRKLPCWFIPASEEYQIASDLLERHFYSVRVKYKRSSFVAIQCWSAWSPVTLRTGNVFVRIEATRNELFHFYGEMHSVAILALWWGGLQGVLSAFLRSLSSLWRLVRVCFIVNRSVFHRNSTLHFHHHLLGFEKKKKDDSSLDTIATATRFFLLALLFVSLPLFAFVTYFFSLPI